MVRCDGVSKQFSTCRQNGGSGQIVRRESPLCSPRSLHQVKKNTKTTTNSHTKNMIKIIRYIRKINKGERATTITDRHHHHHWERKKETKKKIGEIFPRREKSYDVMDEWSGRNFARMIGLGVVALTSITIRHVSTTVLKRTGRCISKHWQFLLILPMRKMIFSGCWVSTIEGAVAPSMAALSLWPVESPIHTVCPINV